MPIGIAEPLVQRLDHGGVIPIGLVAYRHAASSSAQFGRSLLPAHRYSLLFVDILSVGCISQVTSASGVRSARTRDRTMLVSTKTHGAHSERQSRIHSLCVHPRIQCETRVPRPVRLPRCEALEQRRMKAHYGKLRMTFCSSHSWHLLKETARRSSPS